jgi:uncharacterized membrane protein
VIGFSLAETGVSIRIPQHAGDLAHEPAMFAGFAFTFALICLMRFTHHRLFAYLFKPTGLFVSLNFAWLASLAMLVFSLQVYFHFPFPLDVGAGEFYIGMFALTYGLMAIQYAIGLQVSGDTVSRDERARLVVTAVLLSAWTLLAVSSIWQIRVFGAGMLANGIIGMEFMIMATLHPVVGVWISLARGRALRNQRARLSR